MAGSIQISSAAQQAIPLEDPPKRPEERAKSDLWIFREGRHEVSGPAMLRKLIQRLGSKQSLLDCLIQSGELESALADVNVPAANAAASLTDALATMLYGGRSARDVEPDQLTAKIKVPERISVSPPEGFTYYALHPWDYARVVDQISIPSSTCAVIGIRSIGTTLSAVTTAALNAKGHIATRITVRPTGHPYSRITQFSAEQRCWIAEQLSRGAQFLVVDEGPGRSGSTFLSVAEALGRLGISQGITVIGSRAFDPETLFAQDASERWRRLRFVPTTPSVSARFTNCLYLGNGDWRGHFFADEQEWPESWTQMERLKFFSPDRRQFVKFEGMGPLGIEVRARAFNLAGAGFSPAVSDAGDGFLAYSTVEGKILRREDVSESVLERIARYCSFRASEFTCSPPHNPELESMLEFNVQQEFGRELKLNTGELSGPDSVLTDGRMQPFEWIAPRDGEFLKTDAIAHGDNHFFPGPCGISWDLAGAVVEWNLGPDATEFLLRRFSQFSGVDVSKKLKIYLLAYCVLRLGFCKMATSTVLGTKEESRLDSAYRWYRAKAWQLLDSRDIL